MGACPPSTSSSPSPAESSGPRSPPSTAPIARARASCTPIWLRDGDRITGWVITRPTALKRAHLRHSPHAAVSYWDPAHDVAVAECAADWCDDADTGARVWQAFLDAPAPLGYDFAQIFPAGPHSVGAGFLRLDPWRIRTQRVVAGDAPLVWTPEPVGAR